MLVLSRKRNESVIINDNIVVTVIDVRGDKVRIGIEAPRDVSVHRQEVLEAILSEKLKFSDKASEESSGSVAI
ncbi:MAG TPA: carbon storage regulator CsrA [Planctomycetaceae bacterium]|nr:carbon storage regulator CsrA [Planctomycetaceae bacterium]